MVSLSALPSPSAERLESARCGGDGHASRRYLTQALNDCSQHLSGRRPLLSDESDSVFLE